MVVSEGLMDKKIIFIVGNSRSGTTMLGRMFDRHADVHTFGEIHFFEQRVDTLLATKRLPWPREKLVDLAESLITSERDGFFSGRVPGKYQEDAERLIGQADGRDPVSIYEAFLTEESHLHGKNIPCEQTPGYLFSAAEILEMFPNARMINMVRDPRDVLLSQKNKWRRRFLGAKDIPIYEAVRSWANYHPYTISRLWLSAVRQGNSLEGHPRFMSIQFESLLKEPESTMRRLCEFADIEYEAEMLKVPQVGSSVSEDKPNQMGVDGTRAGGWRKGGLTATELSICQSVAGQEMSRLGYEIHEVSISGFKKWGSLMIFALKISLSIILNIRRSRNMIQSIRRRLSNSSGDAI